MKPSRMAGLALLALASACSRPTKPFAIPDLEQVQYVQVSQIEGTSKVWEHEIWDPGRIAPILAHFDGEMLVRDRPLSAPEREALLALIRESDPMGRVLP